MNQNIYKLLLTKLKTMRLLGLVDKKIPDEEYLEIAKKIFNEQEEKNKISDQKINYNDEIVSIIPVGEKETIDVSVTGDSLFYCNNILTKNSIGLAATCDVICSLWQEEEDKELGLIHLGMQKNRFGVNYGHCTFKVKYETLTLTEVNPDHFAQENTQQAVQEAENTLSKLTEG
jgi:glutamine amidotransferase PdxT